uniref:RING-type E3 ubiquitin transferase n=1 Tax=Strix occidentalis caurina TaxID=311401 RepID=A0A8D0FVF7_STROC
MECDLTSLTASLWVLAEPGPVWLVPGLLPSVPARSGGSSEAAPGAGWCFGGCRRQLSVPLGTARCFVPLGWAKGLGEPEGVLCEGPGHFFLSRATSDRGSEWSCPICGETQDGVTYATPCLHQFCLGCIVRWAKMKQSCPLCRQTVITIIYSVRNKAFTSFT